MKRLRRSSPLVSCCVCFLFFIQVAAPINVLVHPQSQSVTSGEQAVLRCEFSLDATHCGWTLDGVPITLDTYPQGTYELVKDRHNGNCTLIIFKVELFRDDGTWVCYIPRTIDHDYVSAHPAEVTVTVIPQGPKLYFGRRPLQNGTKLLTFDGKKEMITCSAVNGNPASRMHWSFSYSNSSLQIAPTTDQDSTTPKLHITNSSVNLTLRKEMHKHNLTCIAEHVPYFQKKEAYVTFNVRYNTTHVYLDNQLKLVVRKGHRIGLLCRADGNPLPNYQWMKLPVNSDNWTVIGYSADYIIQSASFGNEGSYLCLAGNNGLMPSQATSLTVTNGEYDNSEKIVIITVTCGAFGLILILLIFFYIRKRPRSSMPPPMPYLDMKSTRFHSPLPPLPSDGGGYLIPDVKAQPKEKNGLYVPHDPQTPENRIRKKTDSDESLSAHFYEHLYTNEYLSVLPPLTPVGSNNVPSLAETPLVEKATKTSTPPDVVPSPVDPPPATPDVMPADCSVDGTTDSQDSPSDTSGSYTLATSDA